MKYRSGWVVINSETIIENGFIEINNGKVVDFGSFNSSQKDGINDLGPGAITPSLVNCHTHIELSPLKCQIPYESGFESWVRILIEKREKLSFKDFQTGIQLGIDELKRSGCFTIGEISSLFITLKKLSESKMNGICFHEYLGNNHDYSGINKKSDLSLSYAGHAPHSTSPELLCKLKEETLKEGLPFSIHAAESDAESDFIMNGKGSWADFLTFRGIDYKSWPIKDKSPVAYLDKLGILDERTILVHLINADRKDLSIIKDKKCKICLCPRSNFNLHKKLPDIEKIFNLDIEFALGTDSLASVDSLSIFDEMRYIKGKFASVPPSVLFKAATINGAKALNLESETGDLAKGKNAKFLYLDISSKDKDELLEKIVSSEFNTDAIKAF